MNVFLQVRKHATAMFCIPAPPTPPAALKQQRKPAPIIVIVEVTAIDNMLK
jgi:hypothetical protein